MNLGTYAVGFPVFEIESSITFQTIRSPTVFERMVMRLCHRYREEPAVAEMTFQAVFEDVLGVTSAPELVGPCIENLMFLGVITRPAAQDFMSARLQDVSLTQEGISFLERDRLPGRSKQTTVKHVYLPLLRGLKPNKGAHGYKDSIPLPRISSNALLPADSTALVREALTGEKHAWKSANTEIHAVESEVVGTLWESQKIDISADESGALTISAGSSKELQKWIERADSELVWTEILNPILNPPQSGDRTQLDDSVMRFADSLAAIGDADDDSLPGFRSAKSGLVVVRSIESVEHVNGVPAIVLNPDCKSARRVEAADGALVVEVPYPSTFAKGFLWLELSRTDLAPSATIAGIASMSWGGQARSGSLLICLRSDASEQVWSQLRTSLAECLSGSSDSGLLAFSALWEPPEATILRWSAKTSYLPITELVSDALTFAPALEKFAVKAKSDWQVRWRTTLSELLVSACNRIVDPIGDEILIDLTHSIRKLLGDRSDEVIISLLAHASTIDDRERLERIRKSIGTVPFPLSLLGTGLIDAWIEDALSDVKLVLHGPHALEPLISALASAYQRVVRDISMSSLEGSASGTLNVKYVKANALDSAQNWVSAYTKFEDQLKGIAIAVSQRLTAFHQQVLAWRDLACKRLAPPTETDHRLIVLDTSALMIAPDLVARMRSRDMPVLPRRVLEELDGLKESGDAQKAQAARAAIRGIESARSRIRFESEALDLLPPDWDRSSDNRILSVALYLRLSEVLLVTGDINFRNKARAEEIRAQTPDEYRGISQANKATGSGNNKKKGKK
jgi:rRNA-processing protein FCF1